MTITEAIGRLRTWEENSRGCRTDQGGGGDQLFYARAGWKAPSSKGRRDDEESSYSSQDEHDETSYSSQDEHDKKGKGKGKPRGHGKGDRSNEQRPRNLDMSKVKCYNYNKMGHFAKECPEPNKREMRENLATQEDDDPTHYMAEVCDLARTVVAKPTRKMLLHEKKATPKLSGKDTRNQGDRGDHNHHDADTDDNDDMSEDFGNKDAADETVHGDYDHHKAQSDDDHNDDGHGHNDYANDSAQSDKDHNDDGHGHDDYADDTDANDPAPKASPNPGPHEDDANWCS